MNIKETILKNRSYRRYYQDIEVTKDSLVSMIDAARLSPSSRNIQPLKYYISNDRDLNTKIFDTLVWAGYLTEWNGPIEGERPSAYIIQMQDSSLSYDFSCDHGITAQSILLQAVDLDLGGCIIGMVDRKALAKIISLPENLNIINVIAIGKPKEIIVIDEIKDNDYKYWRELDGTHHVPKRKLSEIIINF